MIRSKTTRSSCILTSHLRCSNPHTVRNPGNFHQHGERDGHHPGWQGCARRNGNALQEDDSLPGVFLKKTDTITDSNGNYLFSDVKVTTNPPESKVIFGMKTYRVSASYTDSEGSLHVVNKSFPLYNPNVILGIGRSEEPARNMSANLQFDYSTLGLDQDPDRATGR